MPPKPTNAPPKILVKGPNWVGDALMSTPAIAHLRASHPDAHISVMVRPWVAAVYEHNPDINELLVIDDAASFGNFRRAVKMVRGSRFNVGIALPNSLRSALLLWLGGVGTRVGYGTGLRGLLLNKSMEIPRNNKEIHQIYYYLELLKTICPPPPEVVRMKLVPGELEIEEMNRLLASLGLDRGQPLVGIAPGSINSNAKRWLPESYAQLADWLSKQAHAEVLLLGSSQEKEITDRVAAAAKGKVHNLAGQVNLAQMIALAGKLRGLVCNDAGAMHIGAALEIPTVAIFGPTEHTNTYPFSPLAAMVRKEGVPCAPCMLRDCPPGKGHICMTGVTVEMVAAKFMELVKAAARQGQPDAV